jgi:hypothetical protein
LLPGANMGLPCVWAYCRGGGVRWQHLSEINGATADSWPSGCLTGGTTAAG